MRLFYTSFILVLIYLFVTGQWINILTVSLLSLIPFLLDRRDRERENRDYNIEPYEIGLPADVRERYRELNEEDKRKTHIDFIV